MTGPSDVASARRVPSCASKEEPSKPGYAIQEQLNYKFKPKKPIDFWRTVLHPAAQLDSFMRSLTCLCFLVHLVIIYTVLMFSHLRIGYSPANTTLLCTQQVSCIRRNRPKRVNRRRLEHVPVRLCNTLMNGYCIHCDACMYEESTSHVTQKLACASPVNARMQRQCLTVHGKAEGRVY